MRSEVVMENLTKPLYTIIDDEGTVLNNDDVCVNLCNNYEVHPVLIRKQPKFPSRDRNLAIRRKKSFANNNNCGGVCGK